MSKDRNVLKQKVFEATRDQGVSNVLFRNAIGRKLKLSVSEYECLSFLGIKGVCTAKELANYTGLTTGSTTALLDRLENRKLIKRKANPNDRRGVLVEIREEYKKQAMPLVSEIQKGNFELIEKYSDEELEVIADFLTRFTKNTEEHTKNISY